MKSWPLEPPDKVAAQARLEQISARRNDAEKQFRQLPITRASSQMPPVESDAAHQASPIDIQAAPLGLGSQIENGSHLNRRQTSVQVQFGAAERQ